MSERKISKGEVEHLVMILRTHNPDDPCQNCVRETAWAILCGKRETSFVGVLLLTNGAAGYDTQKPFPKDFGVRVRRELDELGILDG